MLGLGKRKRVRLGEREGQARGKREEESLALSLLSVEGKIEGQAWVERVSLQIKRAQDYMHGRGKHKSTWKSPSKPRPCLLLP